MSPAHAEVARRLESIVNEMRKAAGNSRWSAVADLDMRFHRELVGSSGSARLSRMYASLIDETRAILSVTVSYPNRDDLVSEHGDIARHMATGDVDGALTAVARHFEITIESLLRDREPQDGERAGPA
jgi:DNA-binding GntR family transcriptional regulator